MTTKDAEAIQTTDHTNCDPMTDSESVRMTTTGCEGKHGAPLHEAAVEAMAGALDGRDRNQWRGAHGSIPADPDAWHYQHGDECSYDVRKAAHFALAALVASAEVREGRVWCLHAVHAQHLKCAPDDGLVHPECFLAALAE